MILATTVALLDLWLPILLSTVIVFIASFIVWMVLPHHRADVKVLPDEALFIERTKDLQIPPGLYMWPNCSDHKEMASDAYKQRYANGPWGSMTVCGAKPNFGLNLLLTTVFYAVVSTFVAYILSESREIGSAYLEVFQIAGTTAVMAYAFGSIPGAIFFGKPRRFMVTEFLDAVAYGLLTAGVFAWLWPEATIPAL